MHRKEAAYRAVYAQRQSGSTLVLDGMIDVSRYDGIVFLLKEANQEKMTKDSASLADILLQDGFPWRLWKRVVEWIYAIETAVSGAIPRYRDAAAPSLGERIRRVAVINVNKAGGTGTSRQADINARLAEALQRHPELLREQLEACAPRIVVCGGTLWCLRELYPAAFRDFDSSRGYHVTDLGTTKDVLVLDMCHPGAHIQAFFSFSAVAAMCREAMEEGWRK